MLWSSRIHTLFLPPIALAIPLMLFSAESNSRWTNGLGALAFGLSLLVALRAQAAARHLLPAGPTRELGVFLVHWMVLGLIALPVAALARAVGFPSIDALALIASVLWFGLFVSAVLQAARNGSLVTTLTGLGVGLSLLSVIVAVASPLGASATGVSVACALCIACIGMLARHDAWMESRPTLRRVLIGSFLILGPLPGLLVPLALNLRARGAILCLVPGVVSMAVCLRVTASARRALAYTAK